MTLSLPQQGRLRAAVECRRITRRFAGQAVLDGLDLDIAPGEFVALLGSSGSGKTTLLRTLAGLEPIDQGQLQVPSAMAAVFQEPRLMPWKRVWRNVALGVARCRGPGAGRGSAGGGRAGPPAQCLARHLVRRRGPASGVGPGPGTRAALVAAG